MATVDTHKTDDLTVYTVTGTLLAEEVLATFRRFYPDNVTTHVVWDVIDADISHLVLEDMLTGAAFIKPYVHLRKDGRNAFIVSPEMKDRAKTLLHLSLALSDNPLNVQLFTERDEAMAWIRDGVRSPAE